MFCALCNGPLVVLGKLGHWLYTRCRNCGHTTHTPEEDA